MMQFLRKHQKKLFILIAIMTVASFSFFGTSAQFSSREVEDKKIGTALDGSPIYERDLRALTQFLSMGPGDMMRSDLIETGAFALLAENHFDKIEATFKEKLGKAKTAHFYSHPQAPFISAHEVWNRFSPQLLTDLKEVQSASPTTKSFLTYAKLYMDQQAFPPELLRAILLYDQRNYSWITPDHQLNDINHLALFGYQSFEEWFGTAFSDILGKFIVNTAALAEKKGYKVSQKEARVSFMMMCYQAAKMKSMRSDISSQDATEYMKHSLQIAGIDESRAIKLWRKVMLVHRFFGDMEQGVLLDATPYEQFATFADAKASVEVYQLPEELRLKDFQSMLKVQYYLEAVSPKGKQSFADLPRQFYSVDEIEKRHPQLVISRYELEVAKASQDDVISHLSLKELWDFEMSDAGWAAITTQFPVLNKQESVTPEGREKILDACDLDLRKKVDHLARESLLNTHPEWIEAALESRPLEPCIVEIKSKGSSAPFSDIEETLDLRETLQELDVGNIFHFIPHNKKSYYRIKIVQKPETKEVMTLQKALDSGVLTTLLDEKLESSLSDARKKDSALYRGESGAWKSFKEVKDHVGAYVYADLLQNLSDTQLTFDEYAAKRFEGIMESAKGSIQKESHASKFLNKTGNTLADQWTLSMRRQEIKRSDTTDLPKIEMFTKTEGSWSSIATPRGGNVAFFRLLERTASDLKVHEQVSEGQKLIGRDVKRHRIQQLIHDVGSL